MSHLRRLLLALLVLFPLSAQAAELTLHVFDVGQGDAMLLISPAGKTVLIDAGPPDAADKLAARLKELVHGPIDLMLMTHPHADHIGGMEAALHAVGARLFMEPGYDHPSPIYSQLLKALDVAKVTLKVGKAGNNVELGGGATMHLLAPSDPPFAGTRSDANANSIVMRVVYGKTSFYLAADSEDETEKRILATGEEIGSDVYKVAHHASRHSSSAELLAKIHPRIAVVSVGANNEYGHPTRETLDRLEAVKAEVLRTDLDGEIVLKSDGEHVTYTTEKSDVLVTVAPTDDKGTQPATHPSKVATATHKNGATDKPHDTVAKKPVPDEVVVDTSAHKATAVATTSGYVASKNSQVFHKPGCNNVARIKPDNILHFATRDEAVASGRRPAKDCNP